MSDHHPGPWEHRRTPLARSFDAALHRVDAVARGQETILAGTDTHALMVSGLDVDVHELGLYLEALTAAYVAEAAQTDDDGRAVQVLRGLASVAWLAGRLPGERPATPADAPLAEPQDVTSAGSALAERHRRARVEMYERHRRERVEQLGPDQGAAGALSFGMPLRTVLEMEADRLERMAAELQRWMPGPLWELFDGASRELRHLLEDRQ